MRTLCDVCESAAAKLFCAADEAALCIACDDKFPGDKATRNGEIGLQQIDRGEVRKEANHSPKQIIRENDQNHIVSLVPAVDVNAVAEGETGSKMIDLNARPQRLAGQSSNNQGMDTR
ncbi:hypothetical protein Dimus_002632 [Dionaea muscipula]